MRLRKGYLKWVSTGLAAIILTACDRLEEPVPSNTQEAAIPEQQALVSMDVADNHEAPVKTLPLSAFKTVEWTDLMPKDDLDALLNPPSYVTDIEDGSLEDQISSQVNNSNAAPGDDRYQQALASTRIIPEMDGQAIRIPGFIVPLEFDDTQTITQFFLVPYFGACIHVPPPPPNQLIFVDYPAGIMLDELYDPVWIFGFLKTSIVQNETATAAYSMQMQHFEFYSEE